MVNARVVVDDRIVEPGHVVVAAGRILSAGAGEPPGAGAERVDLARAWLLPGFVDPHVHGGGGGDFTRADPASHAQAAAFHARHGTTSLVASTVSAVPDRLEATVAALAAGEDRPAHGARVLGIHLEGPFLSSARRGAQDPAALRHPDVAELERLATVSGGAVRIVTLAPELPGATALIRRARQLGIIAAAGHTDATYAQMLAARDAGVRVVTHTYNGMRGLHHREPGTVGAALDLDELDCEVIPDLVHAHPAAIRLLVRAKGPERVVLVTDAISAAGLPDGTHSLGGADVRVVDGQARLPGTGTIAGSTATMAAAVRNAVAHLPVDLPQASRMASGNAARLLGLDAELGRVAPGLRADLVLLDDALEVTATMVGGRWVHGPAGRRHGGG
ncbi:MAG: N-acetylglucosamine-6-phosphate deacetylase [Actinobacteria bacterium]|nr:N-acetylglucosamine-6-phosphate deacetylase [Actinomycetota bacterium]